RENEDIASFFKQVNLSISKQKRWKVADESYLSLFSFQKLSMYKDLEKNLEKVASNRIALQIIQNKGEKYINLPDEINNMILDEHFPPENSFQVVNADSSQLRAIATAAKNYDLVLEGPPGTGKSQTITNLIAQALSMGKNVLFVAEKMAALDVVYRRLCDIGLGEICLELHSTKANKRSILKDLEHSLNASLQKNQPTTPIVSRLPLIRESLNNYINSVHQAFGTLKLSPFEMYGELDKVFDAPKMPLKVNISETTIEDLNAILQDINDLVLASDYVGLPHQHPWRETTKTYYSQNDLDEIKKQGKNLLENLQKLLDFSLNLENTIGLPLLKTLQDIENIRFIAEKISTSPGAPLLILQSNSWNNHSVQMKELISEGRRLKIWREQIEHLFTPQVFKQEPDSEIAYIEKISQRRFKFLLFLDRKFINIKKRWTEWRLVSYKKSIYEQTADMKSVADYLSQLNEFKTNRRLGAELFGNYWKSEVSDWLELEKFIDWVTEFRQISTSYRLKETALKTATKLSPDLNEVQILQDKTDEIQTLLQNFCQLVGWHEDYFANAEIENIKARISGIFENIDLAHRWTPFESARQRLEKSFGREVLDWIATQNIAFADLSKAFRRAFFQTWLTQVLHERHELREMHVPLHEQRIKEFQEMCEKILLQNRLNLLGKIRENIQSSLQDSNVKEQILQLRSELTHKNIYNPLRLTMQKCIDAIRTIKPCFMMSPQSVAQLLDTENSVFDLVIFDEASQLPVEDALGSIIRGRQVVI
ncbi:MAG TPA: AAA domain-containing protein, partial [Pyrinomonadaceae bacterium]|nr:AAA domain-containing protein [Pyrinomonadaceae bacterium]